MNPISVAVRSPASTSWMAADRRMSSTSPLNERSQSLRRRCRVLTLICSCAATQAMVTRPCGSSSLSNSKSNFGGVGLVSNERRPRGGNGPICDFVTEHVTIPEVPRPEQRFGSLSQRAARCPVVSAARLKIFNAQIVGLL